jgi:hypothetical protein
MKEFLSAVKKFVTNKRRVNYRDRRAHYVSSGLKCMRDQYWSRTGEEPTDKTDFLGCMKMAVGDAVEKHLVNSILSKLHWVGYHIVDSQVAVGFSNPNVDGYLDVLMAKKNGDDWEQFVIEIKTKSGYGADLLMRDFEPSEDYLSQLGIYLKDLDAKGVTNEGMLFYVLLSDRNFGEIVQLNCKYDRETDHITAYEVITSTGINRRINSSYRVGHTIERFNKLDEHLKKKELPSPDYQYKYELTPEFLDSLSDGKLKSILSGKSLGGDWQPLYSQYKTKQLETDGIAPTRSREELGILLAEWKRRHPRSSFKTIEDFRK